MTERPARPLPSEACPSPLDRLPPFARGYAVHLAEEEARELIREATASGSVYRLAVEYYGPVVDRLLDLADDELAAEVKAWTVERDEARRKAQAEERARKRGAPGSSKASSLSYAQILGREPVPSVRERHEPRRLTEDDAERAAIQAEAGSDARG